MLQPSTVTKDQWGKIAKAALYVGLSAIISYFIGLIADNPNLVGPLTPIINVVLVGLKQVFTPAK